jgi:hypothetical protein
MRSLKNICSVNTSNSLHSLLESSILDIEGTIEDGNKYNNVDLEMLMNAKSESEFNMLYEILKDNVLSTQKTPEIVTGAFGHKFIKTIPGEFYIVFYNFKDSGKEIPAILFGNKDTVSAYWHPTRNKLITSWSNMGFSQLYGGMYKNEISKLPKSW